MIEITVAVLILIATILLTSIPRGLKKRLRDPYGLFHIPLNRLPSDAPGAAPKTEWLNLGYWKEAKSFPQACKALALKLISVAHLKENGSVLDVGHGTGESLLLLLSDPSLPRLSLLVGITSLKMHHERSRARVQAMSAITKKTKVDLHATSAVDDGSYTLHPLSPSPQHFDSILALDCAYHFQTRRLFLEQSFAKLALGGSIALADMCFTDTHRTKILTKIFGMMPAENVISKENYVKQMEEIGYVDVNLEDITEDVIPGFVGFLKGRGWLWWIFGAVFNEYYREGLRFVIVSGTRPRM